MANSVLIETGKLTDGQHAHFRLTTYRVIYKNTNKTTSIASGICERFARKITMFECRHNMNPPRPSRRHPIKNEHNCSLLFSQIIMSLVYINVMEFYTIQKGYDPHSDN